MGIEYIYDEKGKRKGVIIPIELWEELKMKQKRYTKRDIRKYRGIINVADIEEKIMKLRNEWERI